MRINNSRCSGRQAGMVAHALLAGITLFAVSSAPADGGYAWRRVNDVVGAGFERAGPAEFTADGERVVFLREATAPEATRLYSVRRWAGSVPAPLTPVYPAGQGIHDFRLSRDGRWAVFSTFQNGLGVNEIWSVRSDGSAPPVRLAPTAVTPGQVHQFQIGSDSLHVVVYGDIEVPERYELFGAPIDGSTPAVRLHPESAVAGGDVGVDLKLTADGSRILFHGDLLRDHVFELWLAPVDGSTPALRLSPEVPPAEDGFVEGGFQIAPGEQHVVFKRSRTNPAQVAEIWSARLTGAPSPSLLASGGTTALHEFSIDEQGGGVGFTGRLGPDEHVELWYVPIEGPPGAAALLLEAELPGADLEAPIFDAGSERAVFRGELARVGEMEVWTVPTDASEPHERLSPPNQSGGFATFEVQRIPASDRVLMLGDGLVDQRGELWSAPYDGSEAALHLNVPAMGAGVVQAGAAPGGAAIVYLLIADPSLQGELWSAPPDVPGSSTRLSPPPAGTGSAGAFSVAPCGGQVYFRASTLTTSGVEMWAVPFTGPSAGAEHISPAPVAGAQFAGEDRVSPDGFGLLYVGDLEVDGRFDLWLSDAMVFRADFEEGDGTEWSAVVSP